MISDRASALARVASAASAPVAAAAVPEADRIAALRRYRILDTDPEAEFDQMVRLAGRLFNTPIALVSLVDTHRQWFKARLGIDAKETPRDIAFCDHAVREKATLLVPDATLDARFADNPLVTGDPNIRFYAGAPMMTPEGLALGTLCVIDSKPRHDFGPAEQATLEDLARVLIDKLELRLLLAKRQADADMAALSEKVVALTAEAEDFAAGVQGAASLLLASTGGLFVNLWQMDAELTTCRVLAAVGRGEAGSASCLAHLREMRPDPSQFWVARVILSGEPQTHRAISAEMKRGWPAEIRAAYQALAGRICMPFVLAEERYAFVLGLDVVDQGFDDLVDLMRNCTATLRPLLRRLEAEKATHLYRRAIEASPDPVLITQAGERGHGHQRIIYANRSFELSSGYTLMEIKGRSPELLFGAATLAKDVATLTAALEARSPAKLELLNYRKDRSTHWAELNVTPMDDTAGPSSYCVWVNRDVTELRALQAARLQEAREWEALAEAMPGALCRVVLAADGRWRTLYYSPSLVRLTGCSAEDIASPGWVSRHVATDDIERMRQAQLEALQQGTAELDVEFVRPDRSRRIFQGQMVANLDAGGERGLIVIWADITAERAVARHLTNSNNLAQLGELATGMAHELAQPLATISMAVENAQRALPRLPQTSDRVRQKLELVVEMAQRTATIVDNMRVFGSGGVDEAEAIRLAPMVGALRSMMEAKLRAASATLETFFPPELPPMLARRVPLEQVLLNLVNNACDAYGATNASASRPVRIRGEAVANQVRVSVQDQAGGIPEDVLPRVFEPFFTTKAAGEGTGLGLSICAGIIAELGGTIRRAGCFDLGRVHMSRIRQDGGLAMTYCLRPPSSVSPRRSG